MYIQRMVAAIAVVVLAAAVINTSAAQQNDEEPARHWDKALLDDFESEGLTSSIGTSWQPITDNERGGRSDVELDGSGETLMASGSLQRGGLFGGPGTAGVMLPLDADGAEFDINDWDGVRIRIRRSGAPVLLRIVSGEIANGDHFAVDIPASAEFVTYDFPFSRMGQVMSRQQVWRGDRVSAIELTSWSFPADSFSLEIERIELYKLGKS